MTITFSGYIMASEETSPNSIQIESKTQPQAQTETGANTGQTPRNHSPNADAGTNQIVKESENVQLDGSRSNDPDGDKLTYSWQLVSPKNLQVKLENHDSATPNFVVPSLDGVAKKMTLFIKLTVSDGDLQSSDSVRILVSQKNTGNNNDNNNNKIRTLTIIDTGEKPAKGQFFASDVCGDGSSAYSYLVQGVKWRTFPVIFAIDHANSNVDMRNAVRAAFAKYDNLEQPAGVFFKETPYYDSAKIKLNWKYIDGPFNKLGYTTFSYRTDTLALTSATITLDSADKYFVSGLRDVACSETNLTFKILQLMKLVMP